MNVYWSYLASNDFTKETQNHGADLLLERPTNVINDINKNNHIRSEAYLRYIKCPAYPEFFKNVYAIKCDTDFTLQHKIVNEIATLTTDNSQEFFDDAFSIREYTKDQQLIQMNWNWMLFSDSDIDVSVMPAFLHDNNFVRNTTILPGKMNISKWFRPIQPAYIIHDDIEVKTGDVLFYIKIHTKDKIDLKHFDMSKKLKSLSNECLGLKNFKPNLRFSKIYEIFTKRNYNKKILKEIKKNLTGDFK